MSKIFISYRREDSADATGRIYDRLVQQFGRTAVFKDVDSIPLGINFRRHLDEQVAKCDVFLAVIGPGWMGIKAGQEKSRLDDPRDFVRIEIESALKRQIPVIPVLVRGATIPDPERLPSSLQELSDRNGIVVRHDPDFHRDMDRLIEHLRVQIEKNLEQTPFPDAHHKTSDVSTRMKETHIEVEPPPFKVDSTHRLVERVEDEPATSTSPARATTAQSQSYLFGAIGLIVLIGAVAAFLILQPKQSPLEPMKHLPPPVVETKEERQAQVVPHPVPARPAEPVAAPKKQHAPMEKPVTEIKPSTVAAKKEEPTVSEIQPAAPRSSRPTIVPPKQETTEEKLDIMRQPSIPTPQMIQISPGSFMMGGSNDRSEAPIHEVRLTKPFAMARYETTFDEYDRFAQATGRQLPHDQGWGRGQRPVIKVSWDDAKAYAQWLSQQTGTRYRLPTEAEWEYAARSGGKDETWAGTSDETQLKNYAVYQGRSTEPVGSKKPNGLGLSDMSGNVWEWVEDCWHEYYEGAPENGSAWVETKGSNCGLRVVRGGSWVYGPDYLRASARFRFLAGDRGTVIGFRLVQDIR